MSSMVFSGGLEHIIFKDESGDDIDGDGRQGVTIPQQGLVLDKTGKSVAVLHGQGMLRHKPVKK